MDNIWPIIIMLSGIGAVGLLFWQSERLHIVPMPTLGTVRRAALDVADQCMGGKPPQLVLDLGCGWGGFLARMAKRYNHAQLVGYELSWLPYAYAKIRFALHPRVTIKRADIFNADADIEAADLIVCYLSPYHMAALEGRFQRLLKPRAVLVSCAFPLPMARPAKEVPIKRGLFNTTIYGYQAPL